MWSIYLIILREAQIWNNCEIGAVYVIKGHVPDNTIVIYWHDLHIEPILYSKKDRTAQSENNESHECCHSNTVAT